MLSFGFIIYADARGTSTSKLRYGVKHLFLLVLSGIGIPLKLENHKIGPRGVTVQSFRSLCTSEVYGYQYSVCCRAFNMMCMQYD